MKHIPKIKCKQCTEEFQQWSGDPKRSHWRKEFCSRKCQYASFKKPITGFKNCLECGKKMPYRETLKVRSYAGVFSAKSKYCSKKCLCTAINRLPRKPRTGPSPLKGRKRDRAACLKSSIAQRGEKHWNWKGGISKSNQSDRSSIKYKEWRRSVFARDNYTCVECNYKGKGLEPDHIKKWSDYPELRFVVSNGRTLCHDCHEKTPTYRNRKLSTPDKV
jgi:5-methylcytosine-specific restriction endonuclease McrA